MSETIGTKEFKPKLRFPTFQGDWLLRALDDITTEIVESVGDRKYTPVSISAGKGFVSQTDKFGRDISGEQYKRYTLVTAGTFVYNRGNSISFPQGCVYRYNGAVPIAAPAVFTCFRTKGEVNPGFLEQFFLANLHGPQLSRHITSSARSNGLLNISDRTFFSLSIPLPDDAEQRKIAECLESLDELIAAETEKLDALKRHKKGLLQQLFPAEGETIPRLRFPQYQNASEWQIKTIKAVATVRSGTTPSRANASFFQNGTIPWVKTMDLNNSQIHHTGEMVTELSGVRVNPAGSVLIAMYGGFNQIGRTGMLTVPAATNQAIAVLLPDADELSAEYLLAWLNANVEQWKRLAASSRKDANITSNDVANFPICYPGLEEQVLITSSLEEMESIASNVARKLMTLRDHKASLMQQLFPSLDPVEA